MSDATIKLRPGQQQILQYKNGKMGVSAVPGSGKTWTLSYLAADLIKSGAINPDQEILIVTLVNAAVDNFSARISTQLQAAGLLPGLGYRVRTLHGLANDIVRMRPDLAGLSNGFQILDEVEGTRIIRSVADAWLKAHPEFFDSYLDVDDSKLGKVYTESRNLPAMVESIAVAFIRLAKDRQLTPNKLDKLLSSSPIPLPLVEMGADLYREYQDALNYRGSVDFDDLIRLALQCLESDDSLVALLQKRWPYILEDEAQDSSLLQQKILSLLTGESGNWVRVGDPNQAIYETFTTASPHYLLDFIQRPDVTPRSLPESGRSALSILSLANHLINWTQDYHPNWDARSALTPPLIQPTPPGDPQPNPPDCPNCIQLVENLMTPDQEVRFVVDSIEAWLAEHPDKTVAILSPRNARGFKFADECQSRGIPVVDSLLRSTSSTRLSTSAIYHILNYLCDPRDSGKLSTAYRVWRRKEREDEQRWPFFKAIADQIKSLERVEDYLWPQMDHSWLDSLIADSAEADVLDELETFRDVIQRWQNSVFLPIDQLVLTLSQDLFLEPAELALAHKLSVLLRQLANAHPDWRLPEFTEEMKQIANNQRRFLGFSDEDSAFDPDLYPGQVVVATMHKAKGLEWDAVYLTSVNNYNFPSGEDYDQYQSEKWFVRDHLNLEAETLAQLTALTAKRSLNWYQEGAASLEARQEFIRERLRLFFVGVTRARSWLTVTANSGRISAKNVVARAFLELINDWEKRQ
ncbi:MAG: ATP-dependent helicase [Anaerolineaceae bacterium]|nr:ATP-dependent helicase [Anaerolineaceae bacterium]